MSIRLSYGVELLEVFQVKVRSIDRKAPYNISLPVRMMEDFDDSLSSGESRSSVIRMLIRNYLNQVNLAPEEEKLWYSHCGRCDLTYTSSFEYSAKWHSCEKCGGMCKLIQMPVEQSS